MIKDTYRPFNRFLKPLFAVRGRSFALITTPPKQGSFFDVFIRSVREANKQGDRLWQCINHSLICDTCLENGVGHRCTHNLGYVPPWKSTLRFTSMYRLVPARQRANFAVEVLGKAGFRIVLSRALSRLTLAASDTKVLLTHPSVVISRSQLWIGPLISNPEPHAEGLIDCGLHLVRVPLIVVRSQKLTINADPASHFVSSLGLSAIIAGQHGEIVICGAASVQVDRANLNHVQMVLETFLGRLRRMSGLDRAILTPIIECNSSEVRAPHRHTPKNMQTNPHAGCCSYPATELQEIPTYRQPLDA